MKCPICNNEDEGISIDPRTGKFGDCFVCQEIIFNTVQSYPKIGADQDEVIFEEI